MNTIIFAALLLVKSDLYETKHTHAQLIHLHEKLQSCSKDLAIPLSEDIERRIVTGDLTVDPLPVRDLLLCAFVRSRFMDCEANFFLENIVEFYEDGHDISKLPTVACQCSEHDEGTDPATVAFHFHHCLFAQKTFIP